MRGVSPSLLQHTTIWMLGVFVCTQTQPHLRLLRRAGSGGEASREVCMIKEGRGI